MADMKESALTQQSDCKWVRALDSNGNSILISKEDLASVVGGLIGVILGCGASFVIKTVAHWPVFIQPWSVLLSFAVCTVTGVFFGWYPAKKAADLDPIEALRYE